MCCVILMLHRVALAQDMLVPHDRMNEGAENVTILLNFKLI